MSNTIKLTFLGDADKLERAYNKVGLGAQKMGDKVDKESKRAAGSFSKIGLAATAAAAVAGAALFKFGKDAIGAASDLAETQSKVKVLFGDQAAAIERFSDTAAKSLGQSKQSALDAAATFAIFGKGAGLAGDKLTGFSVDMTKLASDLASFNNTSPEDAIVAIAAALRGESEPIRRYGVLLDDASLRNEAFALGLTKTTKNVLTPQQRVLAAQALIMKQTTAAQGDFARTSDGLANKQRIMKAQMANTTAQIGTQLLPVMLKLTTVGQKVIDFVSKNAKILGPLAAVIGIVVAAQWAWNIAMAANPIGLIIIGIAALAAGIIWVATKTRFFQTVWGGVWGFLKAIGHWFAGPFKDFFVNGWNEVVRRFGNGVAAVKSMVGKIKSVFGKVKDFITAPFRAAFNFVADAWNNTVGKLRWNVPKWVPKIGGNSIGAPQLPHFHRGGVVPGSPGAEVLAVLQAGETVTPAGQGGGMSLTIGSDGSRVGDLLVWVLKKAIKEQGGNVQAVLGT